MARRDVVSNRPARALQVSVNAAGAKQVTGPEGVEYYEARRSQRPGRPRLTRRVQKHVTSGNKWGFPPERKEPYKPPPPKAPEQPPIPEPWWKAFCDWRWLASVRLGSCARALSPTRSTASRAT